MVRHSTREAELRRTFTHHVEVPVPADGMGQRLTEMSFWCIEKHGHSGYANFSRSQRAPEPKEWAVFAFRTSEDAEAFRAAWGGAVTIEEG